jgi:hypothetical protein
MQFLSDVQRSAATRLGITRVCSSGLEELVRRFLEMLGKLNRAYLTAVEEKLLTVLESKYGGEITP